MRIIFSRKGFDSGSGGGASPIVDGKPISLPIPDTKGIARTTYGELGLGELAARASRDAFGAESLCHHDPLFTRDGRCLFGQVGAAQTHLANQGVGVGDTFLFFGLFAGEDGEFPPRLLVEGVCARAALEVVEVLFALKSSETRRTCARERARCIRAGPTVGARAERTLIDVLTAGVTFPPAIALTKNTGARIITHPMTGAARLITDRFELTGAPIRG